METSTKPVLKATNRLRQSLAALARLLDQTMNDIQTLDSEFQERIQQIAQDTQASLEQQAAERLKLAVEEAERKTRGLVTQDLQAHFKEEMAAAVEGVRTKLTAEQAQVGQQVEQLRKAAEGAEAERAQLEAEFQRVKQSLDQTNEEHDRALAEADEAAALALQRQVATAVDRVRGELTARWDTERKHLVSERNRAQQRLAELTSEHERQLADAVAGVRSELTNEQNRLRGELEQAKRTFAQLEVERNRLREDCENARRLAAEASAEKTRLLAQIEQAKTVAAQKQVEKSSAALKALQAEIARIEGLIQAISRLMEDEETELSVVIRKNAERAELESYLRGLRFASQVK